MNAGDETMEKSLTGDDQHGHDHAHGHHHDHHHGPGHTHAPADFGRAFAIGITLNIVFVAVEAVFGLAANSMALIADAGHNLSDVLSLAIAWAAVGLARRPPTPRYTYGLMGSSILAALFNAVILLIAVGAIGWEAILRLLAPAPVASTTMMIVAGIGIVINAVTAWLFASGSHNDLNIRGAYLHMAADAAVSAGVVVAGLAILFTGWEWLDPVMSLVIVAVITWGTWGLLRESVAMSLKAVPAHIDAERVRSYLGELEGVTAIHDLHIWPMSTTETALTVHLVMPNGHPGDRFIMDTAKTIGERFGICHSTIQIETDPRTECALAPERQI